MTAGWLLTDGGRGNQDDNAEAERRTGEILRLGRDLKNYL